MTTPSTIAGDEQELKVILDRDVQVFLNPPSRAGSVTISLRCDLRLPSNTISDAALNRFDWRASTLSRPRIGDVVKLSLRHPRYGLPQRFDFVVHADPNPGLVIGAPACKSVLETWTETNRLWLLLKHRLDKGPLINPSCLIPLLTLSTASVAIPLTKAQDGLRDCSQTYIIVGVAGKTGALCTQQTLPNQ